MHEAAFPELIQLGLPPTPQYSAAVPSSLLGISDPFKYTFQTGHLPSFKHSGKVFDATYR